MLNHIRRFLGSDYLFKKLVESWVPEEDQERVLTEFVKAKNKFNEKNRINGDRGISHQRNTAIIYILYCAAKGLKITGDAIIIILYHDFVENWEESDSGFYHLLSRTSDENVTIKFADRVEHLLTLSALSFERQKRNIAETESYLLPLARERGIMAKLLEEALAVAKSYK